MNKRQIPRNLEYHLSGGSNAKPCHCKAQNHPLYVSNPKYASKHNILSAFSIILESGFGRQQGAKSLKTGRRRRRRSDPRTHCLISWPAQTLAKKPPSEQLFGRCLPLFPPFPLPCPAAFTCLPDLLLTPAPPFLP